MTRMMKPFTVKPRLPFQPPSKFPDASPSRLALSHLHSFAGVGHIAWSVHCPSPPSNCLHLLLGATRVLPPL